MDHTVFTLQLHHTCLYLVKHSPDGATTDSDNSRLITCRLLLIYRPREDERLSWPGWLAYSGRFTHVNGYPSAASPVQASESSPIRDRRSTTELHRQLSTVIVVATDRTARDEAEVRIQTMKMCLLYLLMCREYLL